MIPNEFSKVVPPFNDSQIRVSERIWLTPKQIMQAEIRAAKLDRTRRKQEAESLAKMKNVICCESTINCPKWIKGIINYFRKHPVK